jgi:2,3-diketo-5-methylthio-1-phosphopentane phosphatase
MMEMGKERSADIQTMKPKLLIACDFDGTVTRSDTLVEILDRFGDPKWRAIQQQVVEGTMPIREALTLQMGMVRATPEQLKDFLASRIQVEPSFTPFLNAMRVKGIPVVVLSGGFDLCVETVLKNQPNLWPLPFLANRLLRTDGTWSVEFPFPSIHCQACGHCKADPIRAWNRQGYTTVFVGNGVTDRCPAKAAHLTFAKDELEDWCERCGIPVVHYSTFDDIHDELKRKGWL